MRTFVSIFVYLSLLLAIAAQVISVSVNPVEITPDDDPVIENTDPDIGKDTDKPEPATHDVADDLPEVAPDGSDFMETVYLSEYDNPNFSIELKDGTATVTIKYAEMWTDAADPNSDYPEERAEALLRKTVMDMLYLPRAIPLDNVTAVYELPRTTWFPGTDAKAILGTADGKWYYVELTGYRTEGIPEAKELTALSGYDVTDFIWRTSTYEDGYMTYVGEDYIYAVISGKEAVLAQTGWGN